MNKTITIEGMMCQHCVNAVKKALTGIDGVENVEVNLESKTAVITSSKEISDSTIKTVIEAEDFEVTEIK